MRVSHSLFSDRYLVTHTVGADYDGIRLDSFLKARYRRRSRENLKRDIVAGVVQVIRNQGAHLSVGKVKASTQLLPGDEIHILTERKPEPEVNFNYSVLHEDQHLLILDKPAPLPVHPAGRYFFNTLLVHLRTDGFKNPLRAERELYLIHRIDRETSGVLILTKDRSLCTHITEQFIARKTSKKYLSIVHGHPKEDRFENDYPMGRTKTSGIGLKMDPMPVEEGGLPAYTAFSVLGRFVDKKGRNFSLVECFPRTGRQHQIRVHLAQLGHPVVGDKLYGLPEATALKFFFPKSPSRFTPLFMRLQMRKGKSSDDLATETEAGEEKTPAFLPPELMEKLILPRHALHAASIEFTHPLTGKRLTYESPLPPDLQAFLGQLTKI